MHSCILSAHQSVICTSVHSVIYSFIHSVIKVSFFHIYIQRTILSYFFWSTWTLCIPIHSTSKNCWFKNGAMSVLHMDKNQAPFLPSPKPLLLPLPATLFPTLLWSISSFPAGLSLNATSSEVQKYLLILLTSQYFGFFVHSQHLSLHALYIFLYLLYHYPQSAARSTIAITKLVFTFECLEPTVHWIKLLLNKYS